MLCSRLVNGSKNPVNFLLLPIIWMFFFLFLILFNTLLGETVKDSTWVISKFYKILMLIIKEPKKVLEFYHETIKSNYVLLLLHWKHWFLTED